MAQEFKKQIFLIKQKYPDIVITGEWDGQPIWREKTAGERLIEQLQKDAKSI